MSTTPTIRTVNRYARQSLENMVDFARIRFGFEPDWNVRMDFNLRNDLKRLGFGGVKIQKGQFTPLISIDSNFFTRKQWLYPEYSTYRKDPIIGEIYTDDWQICIDALIGHEISHAIQWSFRVLPTTIRHVSFSNRVKHPTFAGLGKWEGDHGKFFRNIYAIMRTRFVNSRLSQLQKSRACQHNSQAA